MSTRSSRRSVAGADVPATLNPAMIQLLDTNRLKKELELRGLDTKGNKSVLADRLENAVLGGIDTSAAAPSSAADTATPAPATKRGRKSTASANSDAPTESTPSVKTPARSTRKRKGAATSVEVKEEPEATEDDEDDDDAPLSNLKKTIESDFVEESFTVSVGSSPLVLAPTSPTKKRPKRSPRGVVKDEVVDEASPVLENATTSDEKPSVDANTKEKSAKKRRKEKKPEITEDAAVESDSSIGRDQSPSPDSMEDVSTRPRREPRKSSLAVRAQIEAMHNRKKEAEERARCEREGLKYVPKAVKESPTPSPMAVKDKDRERKESRGERNADEHAKEKEKRREREEKEKEKKPLPPPKPVVERKTVSQLWAEKMAEKKKAEAGGMAALAVAATSTGPLSITTGTPSPVSKEDREKRLSHEDGESSPIPTPTATTPVGGPKDLLQKKISSAASSRRASTAASHLSPGAARVDLFDDIFGKQNELLLLKKRNTVDDEEPARRTKKTSAEGSSHHSPVVRAAPVALATHSPVPSHILPPPPPPPKVLPPPPPPPKSAVAPPPPPPKRKDSSRSRPISTGNSSSNTSRVATPDMRRVSPAEGGKHHGYHHSHQPSTSGHSHSQEGGRREDRRKEHRRIDRPLGTHSQTLDTSSLVAGVAEALQKLVEQNQQSQLEQDVENCVEYLISCVEQDEEEADEVAAEDAATATGQAPPDPIPSTSEEVASTSISQPDDATSSTNTETENVVAMATDQAVTEEQKSSPCESGEEVVDTSDDSHDGMEVDKDKEPSGEGENTVNKENPSDKPTEKLEEKKEPEKPKLLDVVMGDARMFLNKAADVLKKFQQSGAEAEKTLLIEQTEPEEGVVYEPLPEEKTLPEFHGEPVPSDDDDFLFEQAAGIAPSRRKEKEKEKEVVIEEEPLPSDEHVEPDYYNGDLHMKAAATDKPYLLEPENADGLSLVWGGVRSNWGVRLPAVWRRPDGSCTVAFQIKVVEFLSTRHVPFEDIDPHDVRVGFSIGSTPTVLGEQQHSWCCTSMGKRAVNNHFMDYGEPFHKDDVITALLDLAGRRLSFLKNGRSMGVAFEGMDLPAGEMIFPHVCTKNCKIAVNYGDYPALDGETDSWGQRDDSWQFLTDWPRSGLVRSLTAPSSKAECTVLMMVGLPGVGKTTWVRQYLRDHPNEQWTVINVETMFRAMKVNGVDRSRVHKGRWDMVMGLTAKAVNRYINLACRRRRNYIIDLTNINRESRKRRMVHFKDFQRKAVVLVPTNEELVQRQMKQARQEGQGIPPPEAMLEMKAIMSLPDTEIEPIEEVHFIEPPPHRKHEAEEQVRLYNEDARPWYQKKYRKGRKGRRRERREQRRQDGDNRYVITNPDEAVAAVNDTGSRSPPSSEGGAASRRESLGATTFPPNPISHGPIHVNIPRATAGTAGSSGPASSQILSSASPSPAVTSRPQTTDWCGPASTAAAAAGPISAPTTDAPVLVPLSQPMQTEQEALAASTPAVPVVQSSPVVREMPVVQKRVRPAAATPKHQQKTSPIPTVTAASTVPVQMSPIVPSSPVAVPPSPAPVQVATPVASAPAPATSMPLALPNMSLPPPSMTLAMNMPAMHQPPPSPMQMQFGVPPPMSPMMMPPFSHQPPMFNAAVPPPILPQVAIPPPGLVQIPVMSKPMAPQHSPVVAHFSGGPVRYDAPPPMGQMSPAMHPGGPPPHMATPMNGAGMKRRQHDNFPGFMKQRRFK